MKTMLIMLATVFTLVACNTMQGLGKDVETTGEKIQDKAKK
jgi:predicted small secreted protein